MSDRSVALIGFVNTEEVIAKTLKKHHVKVDGYLLFENVAFANACNRSQIINSNSLEMSLNKILTPQSYDVVYLGPIPALLMISPVLRTNGVSHIGATREQLAYELDKTLIRKIFSRKSAILPDYQIINSIDVKDIERILQHYDGNCVLKFVGDYNQKYKGSPTGRVRFNAETITCFDDIMEFISKSIELSGSVIIEEKVKGLEFSSNYIVDAKGNLFRLGENLCYKRRNNNNKGPMCDATGSIAINNTLPFLNNDDIRFIENKIIIPFHQYVTEVTKQPFCSLLNIDLMKKENGKIVLFEINCREPGGFTAATIFPGLKNDLFDVLFTAQNGKLHTIEPQYRKGVSLAVGAFPTFFPEDTDHKDVIIEVSKQIPEGINVFTGWVDLLEENETKRIIRLKNSPTLLFHYFDKDVQSVRRKIYKTMNEFIPKELNYRTDIGKEFE